VEEYVFTPEPIELPGPLAGCIEVPLINVEFTLQGNQLAQLMAAIQVAPPPLPGPNAAEAAAKARKTLCTYLSDAQRDTFDKSGYFDLVGSLGNPYRIVAGDAISGNVYFTGRRDGEMVARGCFCAHPFSRDSRRHQLPIPPADHHLGQFLELVSSEEDWLAKANCFAGVWPPNYAGPRANIPCPCSGCKTFLDPKRWRL
jgi:hypothetical protein